MIIPVASGVDFTLTWPPYCVENGSIYSGVCKQWQTVLTDALCWFQAGISRVYSESIEKLHGVLSAMQEMSQKRELLEKKLRSQLEGEMRRLRDGLPTSLRTSRGPGGNSEMVEELRDAQIELEILNTSLAADCAKARNEIDKCQ